MAVKKGGLNKARGLNALIDTGDKEKVVKAVDEKDGVVMMKINKVEPNKDQPRHNFNEDSLQELAESVKQHGILSPLIVVKKDDYYQIVAGERRWRAANIAGLKEVPVMVKELTDLQIAEIALIENLQREDLNPIEEAIAYKRLINEFNLKQDEVAEKVSKSRAAVTNSMRLLKLSNEVQQMLVDDMISTGHARALLAVEDQEKQYILAQKVFDEKLSVRDIEKLVKNLGKPQKEKTKKETQLKEIYLDIEEKLKERYNTKVVISPKENGSGKIEIEFYSHEDLDRILDLLRK